MNGCLKKHYTWSNFFILVYSIVKCVLKDDIFRLIFQHYFVKCVLTSTTKSLPKWGFEQVSSHLYVFTFTANIF